MKRTAIFIAIVMIILLGACATVNNEVEAELRATLVAVNVEQTVQAEKIPSSMNCWRSQPQLARLVPLQSLRVLHLS